MTFLTPRRACRPVAGLAAALALTLAAGAAPAQPVGSPGGGARLTPAQWQKIFPEFRQQALQDTRARAAILQQGERCLAAAGSGEALQACLRDERSAMERQRFQHRSALRSLFERNGLPMPLWKNRNRGPGGGGDA